MRSRIVVKTWILDSAMVRILDSGMGRKKMMLRKKRRRRVAKRRRRVERLIKIRKTARLMRKMIVSES